MIIYQITRKVKKIFDGRYHIYFTAELICFKVHKRDRKLCAIANVKRRFTDTVMACPTEWVFSGKFSLGTVHPRGPHDHPNAATNKQMAATNNAEKPLESTLSPPNFRPKIIPTANCQNMK